MLVRSISLGDGFALRRLLIREEYQKQRFVVQGFQEKTNIQADSPTGSKEYMRIVLMTVATNGWRTLHAIDVKSAFLQGKQINRILYLKPPYREQTLVVEKMSVCIK